MVTKRKNSGKGKTKVLNLKKETVKDLTKEQVKGVKGGAQVRSVAASGNSFKGGGPSVASRTLHCL